jgi:hypothetical protein
LANQPDWKTAAELASKLVEAVTGYKTNVAAISDIRMNRNYLTFNGSPDISEIELKLTCIDKKDDDNDWAKTMNETLAKLKDKNGVNPSFL